MAFAPLILRGNLEVDGNDVSDQVIGFTFRGTRDEIEIPATLGVRKSWAGGSDEYEVEISYLPDVDATAITQIFWTALADNEGTIEIGGTLREGATSATNPRWTGVALVNASGIGGDVNTVAQESVTFKLLDRPTQETSDGS